MKKTSGVHMPLVKLCYMRGCVGLKQGELGEGVRSMALGDGSVGLKKN
jgi:hypothetical protein